MTYLGVLARFEERSDANEANLVVPHYNMSLAVTLAGKLKGVLKDCSILEMLLQLD